MGRKKIEPDIKEVEHLAGIGLTNEEIAEALDISNATLYRRKLDTESFERAIARGKAKTKRDIGNKTYMMAMDGNAAMLKWFEQSRFGYTEKSEEKTSGELTVRIIRERRG
jgi:hypothetical protein